MTTSKSKKDWPFILADQKRSGKTIKAYCQEHQLSLSSFYANKSKHSESSETGFAKVSLDNPSSTSKADKTAGKFFLSHGNTSLTFNDVDAEFIIRIIKGLA